MLIMRTDNKFLKLKSERSMRIFLGSPFLLLGLYAFYISLLGGNPGHFITAFIGVLFGGGFAGYHKEIVIGKSQIIEKNTYFFFIRKIQNYEIRNFESIVIQLNRRIKDDGYDGTVLTYSIVILGRGENINLMAVETFIEGKKEKLCANRAVQISRITSLPIQLIMDDSRSNLINKYIQQAEENG